MQTFLVHTLPTTKRELLQSAAVAAVYFFTAKFGLYVFFSYDTSPALIWPPAGIGLIAIMFFGYRMWPAIFLAQFAVVTTEFPGTRLLPLVIASAFTIQPVLGYYLMQRTGFSHSINNLRDALIVIGAAFTITAIAPALTTSIFYDLDLLLEPPLTDFGRAWAGGIFSMLVLVPLAVCWYPWPRRAFPADRIRRMELMAALLSLFAVNYFVFWTPYTQYLGVPVIFFLPIVLCWFALRFHPRFMALAVFLSATTGIAGTLIAQASANPVREQLLTVEIYIGLVTAIFFLFVTVVEDRRAAFRRLGSELQQTAASDQAKSQFLAILAHELRNPLATIVSSLELLKTQIQKSENHELIQNAQDHTKMIQRHLDDLLDTVRLSQGRFVLKKEPVQLSAIIRSAVASVNGYVDENGHTLQVHTPEDTSIELYVDPIRMKQIVINLLSNACKYTDPGGTIDLEVCIRNSTLEITVRDTGIGISEEELPFIFEPFRQLHPHPLRGTGLGIGLYITKRLVEMHNGTLLARNRTDMRGSVFTVTMPIKQKPQRRGATTISAADKKEHYQILIVDDNRTAADLLVKLLERHEYKARAAYSGKEAIELVEKVPPDLVLLDIGMPDMNGYEAAKRIRNKGFTGALIALSGYGQPSDREEATEAGFDQYLVKPVSAADIIMAISNTGQHSDHTLS